MDQQSAGRTGNAVRRVVLKALRLDLSGLVATAIVELRHGERHTLARSVGRNVEDRRLFLVGEATARAVTDLLPQGYGVVLHDIQVIQPGLSELGRGVLSSVWFLAPDNEQICLGVSAAGEDARLATARSVLSAVNRRIESLL